MASCDMKATITSPRRVSSWALLVQLVVINLFVHNKAGQVCFGTKLM